MHKQMSNAANPTETPRVVTNKAGVEGVGKRLKSELRGIMVSESR